MLDEASANVFENLKQAPISEIEPDNLTIKVTIPTLTVDDISSSFDRRINKHAKRFESSLRSARNKNEDRFARFDDDREIKSGDDVREAARLLEDVIAESGIISNLADMMVDIVEDVEFEQDGAGMAVNFEGKRLGKLTRNDVDGSERYEIEGLGSFMTLVRKTVTVNGEEKTRITIEMDEPD